jgi:hypothetical protein
MLVYQRVYIHFTEKKVTTIMGYPPFSDFQTHPLLRTKKNGETRSMIYNLDMGHGLFIPMLNYSKV